MHAVRRGRIAATGLTTAAILVFAACDPAGAAIVPTSPEPGPPPVTARPATLPAGTSSMWQTGPDPTVSPQPEAGVWALALNAGVLYAGGDFTTMRPPGAALGSGQDVAAVRLAAFNTSTGAPVPGFTHSADGRVQSLAVSPDGTTLYAGGVFSVIDGQRRNKLAAFDLTQPGAPLKAWNPNPNGQVRAITVSPDSKDVYFGGSFSTVGTSTVVNRSSVAKVDAATGAPEAWAPSIDGQVDAILVSPDASEVYFGGNFNVSNGVARRALTAVDTNTGTVNGPVDNVIATCGPSCSTRTDVKVLVTDGTNIYVGAEGLGGGWFDGTIAINASTGKQVWKDNCLGATQGLAIIGGVLYDASHAHDCSAIGTFGQLPFNSGEASWHHLMAEQTSNGATLDWFPTANSGSHNPPTGNELGGRAMVTDGTSLYFGGHFTTVNGAGQQGLARFTPTSPAASPTPVTNVLVKNVSGGKATVSFSGTSDPDSGVLSYKVYRDGNYTAPVATFNNIWAHFWQSPLLTFRDSGLSSGSHYYVIDAVDEGGRTARSAQFATSGTASTGYANQVKVSSPAKYWRLDETGTTAGDASGHNATGTYQGSMNQGIPGAIPSDKAIHLGGTGSVFSNGAAATAPNTYTAEAWIRTTTKTGGRIFGFGNSQAGTSSSYDRQLYMNNDGQLLFGVWNGGAKYTWSAKSYNDGYWHHVAVTQGTNGLRLYVDGVLVSTNTTTTGSNYSGWWRVGKDSAMSNWPQAPSSAGFTGDVDEFAYFPTMLSSTAIRLQIPSE